MTTGQASPDDGNRSAQPTSGSTQPGAVTAPANQSTPRAKEPSNPFYALLLLSSTTFVVTGLVLALVPWPELPNWLKRWGWQMLLAEMVLVIVSGLASMALDRWRTLR